MPLNPPSYRQEVYLCPDEGLGRAWLHHQLLGFTITSLTASQNAKRHKNAENFGIFKPWSAGSPQQSCSGQNQEEKQAAEPLAQQHSALKDADQ